jgi:hypothetical protein
MLHPSLGPNQPNFHPPQRTQHNIRPKSNLAPLGPTPLLDPHIRLNHPRNRIPHLCQCKVLPQTDPWSAVEGDVSPRDGGPGCPAVGVKVVYGRTKEVFPVLHDVGAVPAGCVFGDGDGLPSQWGVILRELRLGREVRLRGGGKYLSGRCGH